MIAGVQPPFPLDTIVGSLSTDADVQLEIAAAKSGGVLEDAQDIVNVFLTAVRLGLFCGEVRGSKPSALALEREDGDRPDLLRYRGKCEALDPGAWRVLLATLCNSHYVHEPLSKVRLRVEPVVGDKIVGDALFSWPLPQQVRNTPFPVVVEPTFPGTTEPLIRLEFARKLTDAQFEQLGEMITAWESLILLGGYNESFAQPTDLPFTPGELYRASPRGVENTMFAFDVRAEAFHPLVNLAVEFHETVSPLKKLELV